MRDLHHALVASLLLLIGLAAQANPLPVETIMQFPRYGNANISPSGRFLAVLTPWKERRNVAIIDLETRKSHLASALEDADVIRTPVWLSDNRLVVTFGDLQTGTGEPPRQSGIVAIDRDGANVRHLPRSFERPGGMRFLQPVPGTEDVLVMAIERSADHSDIYRLNTRTGAKELLTFDAPGDVAAWVLDFDSVPRAAITNNLQEDASAWWVRADAKSPWVQVSKGKLGALKSAPVAFSPDGKTLYVNSREQRDRSAIYEYDVASGKMGQAIIAHPERDVQGEFILDVRGRKLLGFSYEDDRPAVAWFDKDHAGMQKAVDAALKDTVNRIQRAPEGDRWVISARSDRDPGSVHLLDGKTFKMEKLLDFAPWIKPEQMAETRWVRYKARDGLVIPALLTQPKVEKGQRVPLIVEIHGGPYVPAASWQFNPEVQFFVSRGYAVLQPQFRGTDGFGWKHYAAGFRKWGEEMQDDLEDGVKWAVAEGIADPKRVCFHGGSYGGYAAMWGAIKNRDLIRCSVAFIGVSSIDYLFDNAQTDVSELTERSSQNRVQLGDPKTERERFKRVSPLTNADRVGVPILLAYGAEDLRVPLVHGTDFRAALDKHGKPYEWVVYTEEGHGFRKMKNRVDFYTRIEKFLATHLK